MLLNTEPVEHFQEMQYYSINSAKTRYNKRLQKLDFLESENKTLLEKIEDLQTTLKINKSIIQN